MAKKALRLDEIGYWSEIKLDIVKKYAKAYSTIMSNQSFNKGHLYIDAFAGAGTHISKDRNEVVSFVAFSSMSSKRVIAEAFRKRLREVAGFAYVPAPIPMRNTRGAVVYYLYFASPNANGARIVSEIFDKYRDRGVH